LRAQYPAQNAHGAMHVRFHGADGLVQNLSDLRMTASFDKTQRSRGT